MNLATWSIRNPIPSILLFILLSLAGVMGFMRLPIQDMPDLDLPGVVVTLAEPGAAPAQLETEVARKVEDSLATLSGLKHLTTTITDGVVTIGAEFVLEKPISDALIETKNAVDRVRSDLPADLLEPTVATATFAAGPIMTYAIASADKDEESLSWFVDDKLSKTVLAVPGVDRLERVGGVQREVLVEADPIRLAALGITAGDLSRALRNAQQQSSGGRTQLGGSEQSIRTVALVAQASDLAALPIVLSGGRRVRLDEVATIRDTNAERTQAARLNGNPAIGFNIYRAKGFDETKVAEGVADALVRLKADYPKLTIEPISGSVTHTLEQFEGSMAMLYEGALLAVVVVFFFLRDWRATLIAAAALPLSILPAFAVMYWLGYSLNTLTLLALAVIVGILVDDAIVEIENIERHRRMGKPVMEAAKDAVTEIALAVTATTMALVAVFLPTTLMTGIPGMLFRQFGWTAVIAVLASLLVARLLTPMMAAYFLKGHSSQESPDGRTMPAYLATVHWCLDHRKTTAAAAIAFLVGSVALVPLIPTGLLPSADSDFTSVSIELPPGSSLERTLGVADAAGEALKDVDGIRSVFTTVGQAEQADGGGGGRPGEVRRAALTLVFKVRGERPRQADIEAQVRQKLADVPGARFAVAGSGPGNKLQLILASDNSQALMATAHALERELRGVPGLSNIATTASLERPEIIVRPDPQRAAEQGVTTAEIGELVRIATSGDFDSNVARLNLDNRQLYIRLRIADAARQDLGIIAGMHVNGRDGPIPLASVASLSLSSGPTQIDRRDRLRFVTVVADLGMPLGDATAAAAALPSVRSMPSSVSLIEAGDAELAAELSTGFVTALIVGVLCIFCVLVLLFKDFLQPVTILSAIPLSAGGAFLALLLAGSELNVPAMIGLVMLTGIVTKNSILLVEYAVVAIKERGLSQRDALIDACHKRARPIVMTTVAMIAGMAPIALGFGADASFRQPMATAVIGGLLTSTALSLLVVPVMFTFVDGFERGLRRWLAGWGSSPDDPNLVQPA